jgi:serine/threonine protein kinase
VTTPSPPVEAVVGSVFEGLYRITRLIGEGGMGAVYEALHLRLNKRVAIKVMAAQLATDPESLARFRREAQVTSDIGHPHIVQVFDFGTMPGGGSFLAMEFLEGEDLDQRIRRCGPMSLTATLHIVKQVVSALAATHAKRIVHRDLKPANIFLMQVAGEVDFVKVLDFGISKVHAATANLTKSSAVMGTPSYMSPEQATGRTAEIDDSTDQWALACIVWEALSGRRAFEGDHIAAIVFRAAHEAPTPFPPNVAKLPPQVEQVLERALCKQKQGRFRNVTEFSLALESAADGRDWVPNASDLPAGASDDGALLATAGSWVPGDARAPSTTLSHTAGDLSDDPAPRGKKRKAVVAGAVMAVVALVLVGGLLSFRAWKIAERVPTDRGPGIPIPAAEKPDASPSPTPLLQPIADAGSAQGGLDASANRPRPPKERKKRASFNQTPEDRWRVD